MSIKLSFIIPLYNAEKYIAECITSIIEQPFQEIEVLVINDASTDNSADIVADFQKKDKRIQLIDLKENKGAGYARNLGLKKSIGKYIFFIDADDWLENDILEKLYNKSQEKKYEIITFGINQHYYRKKRKVRNINILPKVNPHNSDYFKSHLLMIDGLYPMAWGYLYSKKYLQKHNFSFIDNGVYFEDVPFTTKALYYCQKLGVLKELIYNYRIHPASITQSATKKKINDSFTAHFMIRDFLQTKKAFKKYKNEVIIRILSCCVVPCFIDYFKMSNKEKDAELKNFYEEH